MNIDFLKIKHNDVAPKQGRVLVSEPFSQDNYFKRSVVLLTEHNDKGSFGFILNKPIDVRIGDILKDFPDIDARVSFGGPVQTDTIHYLHTLGEAVPDSLKIIEGVYWGGDIGQLRHLAEGGVLNPDHVRFFVGYSGWGPKQLDNEISNNFWIVTTLKKDEIFNTPPASTWHDVLNRMEERYKIWTTFPENPEYN